MVRRRELTGWGEHLTINVFPHETSVDNRTEQEESRLPG